MFDFHYLLLFLRPRSLRRSAAYCGIAATVLACLAQPSVAQERETSGADASITSTSKREEAALNYPDSPRGPQVDDYHGQPVADPYRWLEDVDSDDTKKWVVAQNQVTFDYLDTIAEREAIEKRLTELWNYERFGLPRPRRQRYFYTHNTGLQNQCALLVADSLEAKPRTLLDPNEWSEDGTVALAGWRPTEDGRYLAYGVAAAGSDWREWYVLDVESGEKLEDHLQWIKFSGISWTPDNRGFYYSRYDEPVEGQEFTGTNYYQKLYYHQLGTPQSEDELVYSRDDQKEWGFSGHVTEDGDYLIIHVWRGTEDKNQIFYKPLRRPESDVQELIAGFDSEYGFVGNDGTKFWFVTDLEAPRRRLIAIDVEQPAREHWEEVLPQGDSVLQGVSLVGHSFIASYLQDAHSQVRRFHLDGEPMEDVELPDMGDASGFGGRREDTETFYSFTNFTTPSTIYRYDLKTGQSTIFRQPDVDVRPQDYVTKQVFVTSRDGTKIPMFICHRRDLEPNGRLPTVLYGYGGFNISLTPGFSVGNLVWLERGGVYAVANLRGGGEYGREWHESGMLDQKQNVFDDFIAAAEWLSEKGYTRSDKLAIRGGSNGGLLVGAAMTQRPELFAAALPSVGVMDMLRYHKFTIGWAWVNEYGSSDSPEQFETLLRYSPLHNLKPGTCYPATMVMTADHDDRVVPGHSFKFAAALQQAHAGTAPVIIRIETSAGHGAGTPTTKRIRAAADILAFLTRVLEHPANGE